MGVIFTVLYWVCGLIQLAAFFAGIERWLGWHWLIGLIVFVLLSIFPFGAFGICAITFYGAYTVWHWPVWQCALLAFPFVIFAALSMVFAGAHSTMRPRW